MSEKVIEREGREAGLRWWVVGLIGRGWRCAYVELPEGHPWREIGSESRLPDEAHMASHGGVTWLGALRSGTLPDDPFVVGFDAAHLGDAFDPALNPRYRHDDDEYATVKTADYMAGCARALAHVVAGVVESAERRTHE